MIRKIIRITKDKCNGCGGLEMAAKKALQSSGKFIPYQVVKILLSTSFIKKAIRFHY